MGILLSTGEGIIIGILFQRGFGCGGDDDGAWLNEEESKWESAFDE